MSQLIYVSNNAVQADNSQNPFFLQEKGWLLERFGEFKLICPQGVFFCRSDGRLEVQYSSQRLRKFISFLKAPLDRNLIPETRKMMRDRKASIKNVLKLIRFIADSIVLEELIGRAIQITQTDDLILYSYWLSFDAYACAKIKKAHPEMMAMSRAHSYELQLHRNACNPYLMKDYTCANLDKIAFISKDALSSFLEYYAPIRKNIEVSYLGSTMNNTGYVKRENRDCLTILSCSSIIPIKQLDHMIEALSKWTDGSVHWIHIGDGNEKANIISMAEEKLSGNLNVTYEFAGRMTNAQVHEYLQDGKIDVFVNMSKTEGVPVSIMEAMSAGIPVIAPRMFGIPELIDDNCGILFAPDGGVYALVESLERFSKLSINERLKMGKCAYTKWQNEFCLEKNLEKLFFGQNRISK